MTARLTRAINSKNGTLAISRWNQNEFSGVDRRQQGLDADNLIAMVYPNLFFIETDPQIVTMREKKVLETGPPVEFQNTFDDVEFLAGIQPLINESKGAMEWPTGGIFFGVVDSPQAHARDMANTKRKGMEAMRILREAVKVKPELKKEPMRRLRAAAKRDANGPMSPAYFANQLLQAWNGAVTELEDNSIIDLHHACVPCCYADIVVLDGEWCKYVNQVRKLFHNVDLDPPIANVFPASPTGLQDFLAALEARPASITRSIRLSEILQRLNGR